MWIPQVNEHEAIVHILNNINQKLTDFQQKYKITEGRNKSGIEYPGAP